MRSTLALVIVALALGLSACGGSSGPTIAQRCHAQAARVFHSNTVDVTGIEAYVEHLCDHNPGRYLERLTKEKS